ncbi:MAG TPA: hypothetical protein VNZ49_03900 [Bacteroidia bacterium]|jgi:hypothetical protein|nr:hypothetical protein [Bacteroidia bacterium]
MMRLKNIYLFFVFLNYVVYTQNIGCVKSLIFTSKKINDVDHDSTEVKTIYLHTKKISITYVNGSKKTSYPVDSVWGYKTKDCEAFRLYKHEFYKIEQQNDLILYSRIVWRGNFSENFFYFSYTFDSEIFPVDRKTIIEQFKKNVCMLKHIGELEWSESVRDWDKANSTIRFMVWYKECH